MSADSLTRMANQIAAFFATQPGTDQPAEVVAHLRAFWSPRMRDALCALADADDAALSPLAREAVRRLRGPATPR
ncbi:MAG: formate dehydrogenase subunit delta [Rhodobacterales bacterium]|nr:formate dehydrogenase subunit delta [Rhodobacterales bacterium]NCT11618.1 formate dehydrogenase subunit delta [Rhodobacterales bacterium]